MTDLQLRNIDQDLVLRELGLNVNDPAAQALLLICQRYDLDPLLKQMVLIQKRPYITRDGYLHIAHVSGQLDGIEVTEEGEDNSHWWAKVAVYRKDMAHPFTYKGRYPKSGGNKSFGPEMAIKCAEVSALRRAFNVTGAGAADERWEESVPEPPEGWATTEAATEAHRALAKDIQSLAEDDREMVKDWREGNGIKGWPLPRAQFDALAEQVAELTEFSDQPTLDLPDLSTFADEPAALGQSALDGTEPF